MNSKPRMFRCPKHDCEYHTLPCGARRCPACHREAKARSRERRRLSNYQPYQYTMPLDDPEKKQRRGPAPSGIAINHTPWLGV